MSDIIYMSEWIQVEVPCIFNPKMSALEPGCRVWQSMDSVAKRQKKPSEIEDGKAHVLVISEHQKIATENLRNQMIEILDEMFKDVPAQGRHMLEQRRAVIIINPVPSGLRSESRVEWMKQMKKSIRKKRCLGLITKVVSKEAWLRLDEAFVAQVLGKNILSQPLSDATDRIKVKKSLRGVKVEVTHRENVRRKYRISGLTPQTTRELMFPVDEKMKSVVEYFQEMYGYTIQHLHLPCLQVGNEKKANYLPMETCKIVGGQRYTKRLNDKQITSFLKATCQRPREQEMDILQTVRQNGYDQDPYAKEFDINISDKLASLEARVLPSPWVTFITTQWLILFSRVHDVVMQF